MSKQAYILLQDGDRFQEGDEVYISNYRDWVMVGDEEIGKINDYGDDFVYSTPLGFHSEPIIPVYKVTLNENQLNAVQSALETVKDICMNRFDIKEIEDIQLRLDDKETL